MPVGSPAATNVSQSIGAPRSQSARGGHWTSHPDGGGCLGKRKSKTHSPAPRPQTGPKQFGHVTLQNDPFMIGDPKGGAKLAPGSGPQHKEHPQAQLPARGFTNLKNDPWMLQKGSAKPCPPGFDLQVSIQDATNLKAANNKPSFVFVREAVAWDDHSNPHSPGMFGACGRGGKADHAGPPSGKAASQGNEHARSHPEPPRLQTGEYDGFLGKKDFARPVWNYEDVITNWNAPYDLEFVVAVKDTGIGLSWAGKGSHFTEIGHAKVKFEVLKRAFGEKGLWIGDLPLCDKYGEMLKDERGSNSHLKVTVVEQYKKGEIRDGRIMLNTKYGEVTLVDSLTQPAKKGAKRLEVENNGRAKRSCCWGAKSQLAAGDTIVIGPNTANEEIRHVNGFGSIMLDQVLDKDHPKNTQIGKLRSNPFGNSFERLRICSTDCSAGCCQMCRVEFWFCKYGLESCRYGVHLCWSWCMGKNSLKNLRRLCAKRCKLPYDAELTETSDTAFCCIPLRTAVFMLSVWTFLISFYYVVLPRSWTDADKRFTGGYATPSRVVVGLVQLSGMFFGPIGALGASELKISLLTTYNYFQMTRLFAMFFMLYTDIPLIADCDRWRTDLKSAIQKFSWNPAMYEVALANNCIQTQIDFTIGAVVSISLYIYLISLTRRLIWDTEDSPKYLLTMPRDTPSGAFLMYSRTQGKAKPPYSAIDGSKIQQSFMHAGKSPYGATDGQGLVGPPIGVGGYGGQGNKPPFNY